MELYYLGGSAVRSAAELGLCWFLGGNEMRLLAVLSLLKKITSFDKVLARQRNKCLNLPFVFVELHASCILK